MYKSTSLACTLQVFRTWQYHHCVPGTAICNWLDANIFVIHLQWIINVNLALSDDEVNISQHWCLSNEALLLTLICLHRTVWLMNDCFSRRWQVILPVGINYWLFIFFHWMTGFNLAAKRKRFSLWMSLLCIFHTSVRTKLYLWFTLRLTALAKVSKILTIIHNLENLAITKLFLRWHCSNLNSWWNYNYIIADYHDHCAMVHWWLWGVRWKIIKITCLNIIYLLLIT